MAKLAHAPRETYLPICVNTGFVILFAGAFMLEKWLGERLKLVDNGVNVVYLVMMSI